MAVRMGNFTQTVVKASIGLICASLVFSYPSSTSAETAGSLTTLQRSLAKMMLIKERGADAEQGFDEARPQFLKVFHEGHPEHTVVVTSIGFLVLVGWRFRRGGRRSGGWCRRYGRGWRSAGAGVLTIRVVVVSRHGRSRIRFRLRRCSFAVGVVQFFAGRTGHTRLILLRIHRSTGCLFAYN